MKKAKISIRSILQDIDHCYWDLMDKHVDTEVRIRVWDSLGYMFVDEFVHNITDAIRKKS
jgi:hypothetical protein